MKYFIFFAVLVVSFLLGDFGFAQIVGSIQNIKTRKYLVFTMIIWIGILAGSFFLMKRFAPDYSVAYYIGMVSSLIAILKAGKISKRRKEEI